ncbi:bacillithiol system redox-active protein YtxJ [uncultured Microscilla sp.]|uniref:bacillithiol system redox-active protein YtxJ n=1 Tax=uncultured Microscilla sp. TaxID=432653 RepID=UPI0026153669|nr:bacillithiol system redox-active protein YtxJ [uncultured Microscilla sp.]
MFNLFKKDKKKSSKATGVNWSVLTDEATIGKIKEASRQGKVLIFKHSTRCGISANVLYDLESAWITDEMEGLTPYYLDLIRYREVSNQVAQTFGVMHQSPQVLVIENGKCIYHTSHRAINYGGLKQLAQSE